MEEDKGPWSTVADRSMEADFESMNIIKNSSSCEYTTVENDMLQGPMDDASSFEATSHCQTEQILPTVQHNKHVGVAEEENAENDAVETKDESCMDTYSNGSHGHNSEVGPTASGIDANIRLKMLARVSLSGAHFKHQQRNEPDLTMDEKIEIAQKLLDSSKPNFLARFGDYLELEDLEYFKDSMDIYEVRFYVNQIKKSKTSNFQKINVKNRRFEAMKDLMDKGDYFSDDEMKYREPYLYNQMVGQYLTDDELHAKVDKSDLRFSTILLKHIDQLDENARFDLKKDKEEGQEEEEEDSDEEEEEEMEEDELKDDEKKEKISPGQKRELKEEFLTIMQEKFLQGEDKNFDYSTVDNNEAYDDLKVINLEAEEKYFDDEDSESVHSEGP